MSYIFHLFIYVLLTQYMFYIIYTHKYTQIQLSIYFEHYIKINIYAFHDYIKRILISKEIGDSQFMLQSSNNIGGISEIESYYFYNKIRAWVFLQCFYLSILTIEVALRQYFSENLDKISNKWWNDFLIFSTETF